MERGAGDAITPARLAFSSIDLRRASSMRSEKFETALRAPAMIDAPLQIVGAFGVQFIVACNEHVVTNDLAVSLDDRGKPPGVARLDVLHYVDSFCVLLLSRAYFPRGGAEDNVGCGIQSNMGTEWKGWKQLSRFYGQEVGQEVI